ncbi:MFS transporter [Planctomonas sp. JC2975]|uniref:MFS transporter n=1 Tax=Planctomonas sp. JC2975 TaxID=2729626 RepID=UPI00147521F6|nr:MFS transporter [Planctomonas sp. JC2975]NNC11111.1 MFS transporter [Planctomonas sp. JC2975]
MSTSDANFSIRDIALAAFLPTALFSIGEGAVIPIIPVLAHNLGAGLALAGFIGGMIMVGEMVGDIPSGWIVSRFGERRSMIGSALLCIIGLVVCLLAQGDVLLTVGVFFIGLATSVFALARHAFMTGYVPLRYRARALSTLGGVFRGGWFVGPFISAGVITLFGNAHAVFWVHIVMCVAATVVLIVVPDPTETIAPSSAATVEKGPATTKPIAVPDAGRVEAKERTEGLFRTIWLNREVLLRMGTCAALISALRSSRTVILPLAAVAIGLPATNTALIIGIAGAVDFALFYTSGQIMDRFGRLWSALPSMVGLSITHIALAFVVDQTWFTVVAIAMAVTNGVGSGILMTLGADLAPRKDPAPFLGAWRFTNDAGQAGAPLLVSGITALFSLGVASVSMGVLGLIGAGMLLRFAPRYIPKRRVVVGD